jgi:hypothetical protein
MHRAGRTRRWVRPGFPEHRHGIVKLLQTCGAHRRYDWRRRQQCPALKQADAGIAVAGATDATRAAAYVVLLAPGRSVIVEAIRLAGETFARITNYATYRIAETIRVLPVSLAIVAFIGGRSKGDKRRTDLVRENRRPARAVVSSSASRRRTDRTVCASPFTGYPDVGRHEVNLQVSSGSWGDWESASSHLFAIVRPPRSV